MRRLLIRNFAFSAEKPLSNSGIQPVEYKKLKYLCEKRGMKETELLLGGFFNKNGKDLTRDECRTLEVFLQEPDPDILNWLLKKTPLPKKYRNENVVHKLQNYWCAGFGISSNQF